MYVIMKNGYFLLFLFFGFLSYGQQLSDLNDGEEQLDLNGKWKFNAIYGEGSNYNNIKAQEDDLVIDNTDEHQIEIKGDWIVATEGERESRFYGTSYLKHHFGSLQDDASVSYVPKLPASGYYEAFVRFPFAINLNTKINIHHAKGTDVQFFNQRTRCDEWLSLGIFTFEKDKRTAIEITSDIAGVGVSADAVLFRPVSNEKIKQAELEKKTIFLSDFDDSHWDSLKVPGHYGMINEFSNYTGKAWYRRTFETPAAWQISPQKRIRLKFDGIYHIARVYLNGALVGTHQGGFTPFEIDVTENISLDNHNLLAVETDNNALVGATWNWGGIIRDVTLVRNDEVRIKHQYIHADPDLKTGKAELHLKIKIENSGTTARTLTVNSQILNEIKVKQFTQKVTVPANSMSEVVFTGELSATDVELWHFDNPHLYQIVSTISENEKAVHELKDRFGIRKVTLTKDNLILNGEAVRLSGFNRVSDHRYWGSSEPQELIDQDVDLMKNAGANFMRIMHGTQNKKLIERCDEKGILLFEEVNVRDLDNAEFTAPEYPLIKSWIKGMIDRDSNSPSIIGWSVGNELADHYDYATMMMDYVRALDPYRLVTCVSNTGGREDATRTTDPNSNVDIIMHNLYPFQGTPQEVISSIRSKWPNKPVFISEYGVKLNGITLDEDLEENSSWNDNFRGQNNFVVGTSLWTFNDYRSAYIGTNVEENRTWGIVNAWRQKRKFYSRLQKETSPVKDIDVVFHKRKATITIPIRARNDFPSFTMKDDQLVWEFINDKGEISVRKTQDLPVLHPENGVWTGEIPLTVKNKKAVAMHIALLSPNGYTRFEKNIALKKPAAPKVAAIVGGRNSARVYFEEVPGAKEYFIQYKNLKGLTVQTAKTIANYITVDSLPNSSVKAELIAVNNKGAEPTIINLTSSEQELPPIVWDAFIRDDRIVVGYSGELNDEAYTVRYGTSPLNLDQQITTYTRGMMTIPIQENGTYYLQIQKKDTDGFSHWSPIQIIN